MNGVPHTAALAGLVSCRVCGLLTRATLNARTSCPRCGAHLATRYPASLQRTWAYIIAAAICYVPANLQPVMVSTKVGSIHADTILGGVVRLYETGTWPLALIVLIASVMIPLGKLIVLAYLAVGVQRRSDLDLRDRTRLYRLVDFIGRWSMLDAFIATFVVAILQIGPVMTVKPGPGLVYFVAVVILTMLASRSFDPRLIWDRHEEREVAHV
jgi:paraquat-inducible protein A